MAEIKLAEGTFLTDDFLRQLINVGEVDILVGVPTHNNAKTIGSIVETIQAGILTFFPRERAAIINADGGSRDGTPELVVSAAIGDAREHFQALRAPHVALNQHAVCEQSCPGDSAADHFSGCRIAARQGVRGDFPRVHSDHNGLAPSRPAAHLH